MSQAEADAEARAALVARQLDDPQSPAAGLTDDELLEQAHVAADPAVVEIAGVAVEVRQAVVEIGREAADEAGWLVQAGQPGGEPVAVGGVPDAGRPVLLVERHAGADDAPVRPGGKRRRWSLRASA